MVSIPASESLELERSRQLCNAIDRRAVNEMSGVSSFFTDADAGWDEDLAEDDEDFEDGWEDEEDEDAWGDDWDEDEDW